MSNLIERQSAIDEWKNDFKGYVNSINIPRDDYNGIMEYIDELPSAEPERKPGRWIYLGHGYKCPWSCSECDSCSAEKTDYCPDCGAKMEVDNNERFSQ